MTDHIRFWRAVADQLLARTHRYDPLAFLCEAGFVDEDDLAAWPASGDTLQSLLLDEVGDVVTALQDVQAYVCKLGLSADKREPPLCANDSVATAFGDDSRLVSLCAPVFRYAHPQRSLFWDNTATIAANTVRDALVGGQWNAARDALAQLRDSGDSDQADDFARLLAFVEDAKAPIVRRLDELDSEIAPLARRCLQARAQDFLTPLWQALARRLSKTHYTTDQPRLHASYANLQAHCYRQVIENVLAEADWRAAPPLLLRLAEAQARIGDKAEARRVWSQLCWSRPDIAETALGAPLADPIVSKRWREFADIDAELPAQHFPAWLLIADLRQREYVPPELAFNDVCGSAYRATYELIVRDDVQARARLQEVEPALLRQYLSRKGAL